MSPLAKKQRDKEGDENFKNKSLIKAMYDDVMKQKKNEPLPKSHSYDELYCLTESVNETVPQKKEGYEEFLQQERLLQININECMLCLTEIANCVIMECGHSSICFECTMRLAIKARQTGKPPYCHLCRKIIKYALKIQVPEDHKKLNSP